MDGLPDLIGRSREKVGERALAWVLEPFGPNDKPFLTKGLRIREMRIRQFRGPQRQAFFHYDLSRGRIRMMFPSSTLLRL
jgi:hypothetical protein